MAQADPTSLTRFLDRLTARSTLNEDEQQAILSLPVHPITLKAKRDLVQSNEGASYSCLIESGMVARFGQTSDGSRQITAFHLPGDMADLNTTVRPVGVGGLSALCETRILRVPHSAIRAVATSFPAVAEAFWRDCMLDTAILMQWIVNVGRRDARTRLAHILCEMSIRSGHNRKVTLDYAFPVNQEQLADAAGLTSVHVNRSLRALRDQKLATVRSGRVQIHDWAGLSRQGEFDPAYLVADIIPQPQKQLLVDA